jgi:hypothetical protein
MPALNNMIIMLNDRPTKFVGSYLHFRRVKIDGEPDPTCIEKDEIDQYFRRKFLMNKWINQAIDQLAR